MLTKWQAFKIKVWNWCRNSGTLVWARLQLVVGVVLAGLVATFSSYDWSQLASIDSRAAFKILLGSAVSGIITEFVRRKGTYVQTQVVSNAATSFVPTEVKTLERVAAEPPPSG